MAKKISPLTAALAKAAMKKPKAHQLPKPKEPKYGNIPSNPDDYYYPPTLYLSQKELSGIDNYKVGQKVQLAISAEVTNVSMNDTGDGKSYSASLKLTEISDITPGKGEGS